MRKTFELLKYVNVFLMSNLISVGLDVFESPTIAAVTRTRVEF